MHEHQIGDLVLAPNDHQELVLGTIREVKYRSSGYGYRIMWSDDEDLDEWYYEGEVTNFKQKLSTEMKKVANNQKETKCQTIIIM
jgi:hypothetical protein